MKRSFLLLFVICFSKVHAQNVAINAAGNSADASAILDVSSSNKGLLIPRIFLNSLTDAGAIANPATSLLLYNTNTAIGTGFYYNSNTPASPVWTKIGSPGIGSGWALGGNAVTANDFIGTTNQESIKFKLNNQRAGIIDLHYTNTALGFYSLNDTTTGNYNIAFGYNALAANGGGDRNIAVGYNAMHFATEGYANVAVGQGTLYNNTIGENNIGIGSEALLHNIDGNENVGIGESALWTNSTGDFNIAVGRNSLYNNISGGSNIALGPSALYSNKTGSYNIASGPSALMYDTSGSFNIATGSNALYSNRSGDNNISIGSSSLYYNLTGNSNIAIGRNALYKNTATENVALGYSTLQYNTTGYFNTAVGSEAMPISNTGYGNTAVGYFALNSNTSGNRNTGIGYLATANASDSNCTVIGANSYANCNDCVVFGSSNINTKIKTGVDVPSPETTLQINPKGAGSFLIGASKISAGYTNLEIGITASGAGYSYIQSTSQAPSIRGNIALNPLGGKVSIRTDTAKTDLHIKQSNETYPLTGGGVRFERQTNSNHWDVGTDVGDDLDFIYNGSAKAYITEINGSLITGSDLRLKKDIQLLGPVLPAIMQLQPKIYHYKDNKDNAPLSYGFIAQEAEQLFPDLVFTKGDDGMKAIAYQEFTVIAIKAIQEQQKQIEQLKEQNKLLIEEQQKTMQRLEERIKALENK